MRRRDIPVAPMITSSQCNEEEGLNDAAKAARDKRKALVQKEKELIISSLKDIKNQPRGVDIAVQILKEMITKYTNEEVNALKSFLKTLLENVSRNPDNEMLRTLRANNTTVYEKVTRYPEGLKLLTAIGFTPIKDDEAIERHFNQSLLLGSDGGGAWKDLEVMSVILMKLIEPSPEVDMEAWISWFDGLKERAAIFA